MRKIVPGIVILMTLSACSSGQRALPGGGTGLNTEAVCHEQSRWATVTKVGGGDISITCADGYNAR